MTEQTKSLANKRIGVLGKGGSGKSTVVALLAKSLKKQGYQVCVLDADSTNVGLARVLGLKKSPIPLIEYFGGMVFSGGSVGCPVDDPAPLSDADLDLKHLPRGYYGRNDDGIILLVAGKMGAKGPCMACDGPIAKIARDLRLHEQDGSVVTMVDFKAGIEDSARGVLTGLDWGIVVIDPTLAALHMASSMNDMVRQLQDGVLPPMDHLNNPEDIETATRMYREAKIKGLLFLLNKISSDRMELYLRGEMKKFGISPIAVIREDSSISESWLRGIFLDSKKTESSFFQVIMALETAERKYESSQHNPLNGAIE